MVALDGETPEVESGEPEEAQLETLAVPAVKKRKGKSPTPGGARGRSATPIHGRSQTPFSLYLNRRSGTPSDVPSQFRSITPFLKRDEKERTPFELGKDIKAQLICNKMVFDKALVMDISEPEVPAVRYITSDISVIDRAAVMDISNVEVIYMVEEYEEEEEIEEEPEEEVVVVKKKGKGKKGGKKDRASKEKSETPGGEEGDDFSIEDSPAPDEKEKKKPKGKKPAVKKEKKEKSPSPKLTLKLELGAGPKANKKLFDQPPPPAPESRPPPKKAGKSKLALQMEEQAKAAAAAAAEAAAKKDSKPKSETFEERQKRLKEEEEIARQEEEQRRLEEEAAAEENGEEDGDEGNEEGEVGEEGEAEDAEYDELRDDAEAPEDEEAEVPEEPEEEEEKDSDDEFIRPDPGEEERWQKIAAEEGEEFAEKLRKFSRVRREWLSEKQRDAAWQQRREQAKLPAFINFLTDRAAEEGQTVRLVCAVSGPELSIKWFKSGRQLEPGPHYRIINNNNILSLQIMNCTTTDSGEYSCVVANLNDEVASSCIVTIYQVFKDDPSPPTCSLIRDFYHTHDDELTIECHFHGIPRPKVTWIKDNFEIKPSYKFTILEEAHGVYKLLIYRPSAKDGGIYICKAVNDSGEQLINHTIVITKNTHYHMRGVRSARNLINKSVEVEARKAMDEAMKSKAESDSRRQPSVPRKDEPLVSPKQKLKFATQLRDRMAIVGTNIKLVCNVIGPDPSMKWLKDDNAIQWGPKVKNASEASKAVLELLDVSTSSSGVYKCIAKNDHCEIETSCYLKIYNEQIEGDEQDPIFALPIKDTYHSSENDLILSTKVRGNPRPKISWIKDDLPVVIDERIQQTEHLDGICELIINKPSQTQDTGVYQCIAENKLGTAKSVHTVVFENLPSSRRSSLTMSLGGGSDTESLRVKKEGSVTDGGTPLPPSKKEKKQKTAEPAEEGGGRRRVAQPEPSLKEKVNFVVNMNNRCVSEGSRVKMQAVISGPDPQIKFLKNGNPVVYGPKIRNQSREGMAVLEFVSASLEDSAEYTLICRNQANEITTTALLEVYQAKSSTDNEPVFTRAIKDTYYLNSNELKLECHVRGEPTPTVQWYKDSVEITNSEKHQLFQHDDGKCELIIDKPKNQDMGKYVCKAENRAGTTEISHKVLFETQATHIAEHIHGVFHADKNLLKKTQEPAEVPQQAVKDSDTESVSSKGKGKGKSKPPSASSKEATPVVKEPTPAAKEVEEPVKETKREKRIGIYFAAKLSDRVVAAGSKVKLSCYVESSDPAVRWYKNDQPVAYGPKTRQNFSQGLALLELPNAAEDDSGIYKCIAKDGQGEVSTSCKLTVFPIPGTGDVPPTFTRSIKDTYRHKMNELVLDVHCRGLPTPTVTWVKDAVKLEPSEKYQVIQKDDGTCELYIADPVPMDKGKYICKAENRAGEVEISHLVVTEIRQPRPSSPILSAKEEEESVKEDISREGSKTREGSRAGSKPPTREPSVKEDGEPTEKKEKKKKVQEVEYAGRREAPPPPDPKKQLYFGNFLTNRTVAEGSQIRFSVYIGGPDPTCKWFKDDQPIIFTPKTKMTCQDNLAILILLGLTEEDTATYKLVARGTENEIETSCNVLVYKVASKEQAVGPVFTVGIKDQYSLSENELILDCRVRGKPQPKIKWTKGNEPIVNNEKYTQLDQTDGYCKLIISNPTVRDSGIYVCEAENSVSSEKVQHEVVFDGQERFIQQKTIGFFHRDHNKPNFLGPLGNHIVTIGGTAAIHAEFAECSSEISVQWLKNKTPIQKSSNIKTFADRGVYTLAIEQVSPNDDGVYTCRAQNAFGKAESTANVHISSDAGKSKQVIFLSRPDAEMKIAVGDPFSISFRVQGDPKPKLTLMKGTKDMTRSDRVSKEVSDDYTRFTIHNSKPTDSGTYWVIARNEESTDRIFTTITVKHPKPK